jgi:hypothetical protein
MARPAGPALAAQDDTALQTPGAVRDRLIAQMRRQGVKGVRLNAIYGRVKAEGYGKLDDEVNALRAAGIQPQITLMGTPAYSPQWDQTLSAAHNNPRVWQQFAGEVAKHFRGRVGRYSVGNEENIPAFLAGSDANPVAAGRQYRGIYRAGYAGIKSADHSAQVLLGELTSATNARDFLRGVLAGKPLKTSGLAYHPYTAEITGGAAAKRNSWDINNLPDLQATLARYKRQGKLQTARGSAAPLYLTEYGLFRGGQLSDAERMRRIGRAYALARHAGARQFLQYQLTPTARKVVPGQVTTDMYGSRSRGAAHDAGWVWDTSIGDAAGNLPVINRGLRVVQPRGRAAIAKRKR